MKTYEQRRQAAMDRYREQLDWYVRHAQSDQVKFKVCQVATLAFSAVTPVLLAFPDLPEGIAAATSALAAISAGAVAVFNWRGNWIRFARTAELLKSELACLETCTPPAYPSTASDEELLETFMSRIEAIALGETGEWGVELRQASAPQQP